MHKSYLSILGFFLFSIISPVVHVVALANSNQLGPESPNPVLTKLLADSNIQQLLGKYNNVLYVSETKYCEHNDCENLFAGLPTQVEIRVHKKEDLFMRRIPDYLEIIDLRPGYVKAIIHGLEINVPLEIKE
jgi:hypothetical protein